MFYSDVRIDKNALNNLLRNCDKFFFNKLKIVHMEFDPNTNEIIFVGSMMETNDGNIIEYTTSMASQPPIIHIKMKLIPLWVNNFDTNPIALIDYP